MSAIITFALSSAFTTTNGTKATLTPAAVAVGDLAVVITTHTGNTSSAAPTDDNSDGLGTYSLINTAQKNASADTMRAWVRDAPFGTTSTTTITHAPGTTTGGGLLAWTVSGMTRAGSSAVRQSAKQDNQSGGGTPTPVLGSAALTGNPLIGAVFNASNPAGLTARSSPAWTEDNDGGYNTPTTGREGAHINSGETATSIAWGGTSASAFCSIVVELDSTVPNGQPGAGAIALTGLAPAPLVGTIRQPGAGAAIASGLQPAVSRGTVLQPAAGAATITGQAPIRVLGTVTQPGSGALVTTGQAPALLRGTVAQPSVGSITIAGLAPAVLRAVLAQPGAGALTLAGVAPTPLRGSIAQPAAGSLVITGLVPTVPGIPIVSSPGAGALSFSGAAPTLNTGPAPARMLAASAMGYLRTRRIVGLDPGTTRQPELGSLTITGLAPVAVRGSVVQPGAATLTLTGLAPIDATQARPDSPLAAPSMGYLRIRRIVTLDPVSTAQPDPAALLLTGLAPVVGIGTIIPAGALSLTGLAPVALRGAYVQPGAGALTIAGAAPALSASTTPEPGAGAIVFTGQAPTALATDHRFVDPGAGALAFSGYEPAGVPSSPQFEPDACALAIFGCEPTIVVTSDGILSAKYLGGGRRKNVPFKPVGGKKKKDEPKKPEPSPLLLGLLARGLALPPVEELPASIVTPQLPEIVLAPLAPAPLPTPEELLQARVDSLEQQMQAMRAEIVALRAPVAAAPASARDPVFEAMHAILPAIGRPIDLDAGPPDDDEIPDEPVEIAPPPPAPPPRPKMTREEIERENERRAAMAAELLL